MFVEKSIFCFCFFLQERLNGASTFSSLNLESYQQLKHLMIVIRICDFITTRCWNETTVVVVSDMNGIKNKDRIQPHRVFLGLISYKLQYYYSVIIFINPNPQEESTSKNSRFDLIKILCCCCFVHLIVQVIGIFLFLIIYRWEVQMFCHLFNWETFLSCLFYELKSVVVSWPGNQ